LLSTGAVAAAYPLRQAWVQAGSTLLDGCEVESRRVDDRLKEVVMVGVVIGSRNRRMLPHR
jgi:hypothetical protein